MIEPSEASAAPSREESELAASLPNEAEQRQSAGNGNPAKETGPPRMAAIPDPEVSAFPKRRRFSADYKALPEFEFRISNLV